MARRVEKADAFGHALMEYWCGGDSLHVVERDDGYVDPCETSTYFSAFRAWQPYLRQALRFVRGRVVDVGCGAGRHVQYLQRRGYDVTGIDPSPLAVKVCRMRGVRKVQRASLEDLPKGRTRYDTFLFFGNNFGLFGSRSYARTMLRQLHRCSTPQARIIAECRNPYKTSEHAHLRYNSDSFKRGRMFGQIRIRVRFRQYTDPWFDYLFVSPEEMRQLVNGTGWRVRRIIGHGAQYAAVIEKEKVRL